MLRSKYVCLTVCLVIVVFLLSAGAQKSTVASHYMIYATNERSGDLSVIDSATFQVVSTVPLGKRPRGIHPSPDGRFLYIALSGSPIAGPGQDESKLPPPDRTADGIGVFRFQQAKIGGIFYFLPGPSSCLRGPGRRGTFGWIVE